MVLSFALTYTSDPMVVLRGLALLLLSPQKMPAMPFNNSTAMIGKAAHSRSVKTASQVLALDLVAAVASVDVVVSAEVLVVAVVALGAAVASEEVSVEVVVVAASAVDMGELQVVDLMQVLLLQFPTPSPTSPPLEPSEAKPSMFAT